jgi:hypothetical protein
MVSLGRMAIWQKPRLLLNMKSLLGLYGVVSLIYSKLFVDQADEVKIV